MPLALSASLISCSIKQQIVMVHQPDFAHWQILRLGFGDFQTCSDNGQVPNETNLSGDKISKSHTTPGEPQAVATRTQGGGMVG